MREGVAGERSDGVTREGNLGQRGGVPEAVRLDVLEGGVLNLLKGEKEKSGVSDWSY